MCAANTVRSLFGTCGVVLKRVPEVCLVPLIDLCVRGTACHAWRHTSGRERGFQVCVLATAAILHSSDPGLFAFEVWEDLCARDAPCHGTPAGVNGGFKFAF